MRDAYYSTLDSRMYLDNFWIFARLTDKKQQLNVLSIKVSYISHVYFSVEQLDFFLCIPIDNCCIFPSFSFLREACRNLKKCLFHEMYQSLMTS